MESSNLNPHALRIALSLIVAAPLTLFAACGGSDDSGLNNTGTDGGGGSDASADGGGPVDGSVNTDSSVDAGTVADGSVDAGADSGIVSDPHKLACETETCTTPNQACCNFTDGGAACTDTSSLACGANGGTKQDCKQAADCSPDGGTAILCCDNGFNGPEHAPDFVCGAICAGPQVCRTDAECTNGQTCVTQTCHGRVVDTCGALNAAQCPP